MSPPHLTVILPTHNPHPGRLERTLAALQAQTLSVSEWEFILVDNASTARTALAQIDLAWHPAARLVREPVPGLTPARLCGIHSAGGEVLVFVDDDNVLAPDYLTKVAQLFAQDPKLGAAGGIVKPEWETPPPPWLEEFRGLLALRDSGAEPQLRAGGPAAAWPDFAPVGAGLCVRRAAAETYVRALASDGSRRALDRTGDSLASGGDCDLVFTALHAGWSIGYFPELGLTHLIPASRLDPHYLGRLNQGIMRSWVCVLHLHGQCPWKPIPRWTVPLRGARAWMRFQPWRSSAARIRWRGAIGQFQGQADLSRLNS
jgi:glycosyltransferase involved in cell wall biosynthesis